MMLNRMTVFNQIKALEEKIKVSELKLVNFNQQDTQGKQMYNMLFSEIVKMEEEKERLTNTLLEMTNQSK